MMRQSKTIFALTILWLLATSQHVPPTNSDRPVGAALDSLLKDKPRPESIAMIQDFTRTDIRQKDWYALERHVHKMGKLLEQDKDWATIDSVASEAIKQMELGKAPDSLVGKTYMWRGFAHRRIEQWTVSLNYYQKAIRSFERGSFRGPQYSESLSNAAQIMMRFGDYPDANALFSTSLKYNKTQRIYTQAANCYYWQDSLVLAQDAISLAINCTSVGKRYDAAMYATAASIQLALKQFDQAEKSARQAILLYVGEKDSEENVMRIHTTLAEISTARHLPTQAIKHYKDAEAMGLATYKGKSREMAKLYTEYGDACKEAGQQERAAQLYQMALAQAWPGFDALDLFANPDTSLAIPCEQWAAHALTRKAKHLLEQPKVSLADRYNAAHCFDLAWRVTEGLSALYQRDEAKLALLKRTDPLRKLAANNLLNIIDLQKSETEKQATVLRLFDWIENGRALVLRDALREQRTLESLQLPAEKVQAESTLRRDMGVVADRLQIAIEMADTTEIVRLQEISYKLSQSHAELLNSLEQAYPAYAKYRNAADQTRAADQQKTLTESEALCSWLHLGDSLLCTVLTRNRADVFVVPFGAAEQEQVSLYQRLLADRVAQENDPRAFLRAAHEAYGVLLAGGPASLHEKQNWVMVPDGPLVSLPFEAMVTDSAAHSYGTAAWLLKSHNIRYLWSASLRSLEQTATCTSAPILHMQPFQSNGSEVYEALPNSVAEVQVKKRTKTLTDADGTAVAFRDLASDFSLVHLSTHADPKEIRFSDGAISLAEVYGMTLKNSLIVLSACQTNVGKYAESEGALSLARAFAYAGAQSLIASYWKVNDRSTAVLFGHFYTALQSGKTKSEALRAAKLAYLSENKHEASMAPWHWAAFTFYGNEGCVELNDAPIDWYWWAAGLVMCGLLATGMYRFRRSQKPAPHS
jgi:CHAT domain-containing protein